MKKYVEKVDRWKTAKVLEFLGNFLKNHQGSVSDNDLFKPITDLTENCDWEKKIKAVFPEKTIDRMENFRGRRDRLDFTDDPQEIFREVWNFSFARKRFAGMLIAEIKSLQKKYLPDLYANELFPKQIDELFPKQLIELQKTFSLSDFEVDVMLVLAFVSIDMLTVIDGHSRHSAETDKAVFVAKCLDCDVSEVMAALDCKEKLRRYNCVDSDFDFNRQLFEFLNGVSDAPLSSNYFKHSKDETLPWDFYGNLAAKHGTLIKNILQNNNGGASNILLYGAPGTGKTSFAKTLADQLGKRCYIIAQDTKERDRATSTPEFRFAALQICDAQVDPENSLIIVDEADEMLQGNSGFGMPFFLGGMGSVKGDKGLLNDVLDNIKTPTIWITNTPAEALKAARNTVKKYLGA